MVVYQLILSSSTQQLGLQSQNSGTNNIPPATITKNKSLDTIFLFELKKLSTTLLFNGAILEEKPITTMYTDAKVDGYFIKLILDSKSTGSIITKQLMDQLGHRVDQADELLTWKWEEDNKRKEKEKEKKTYPKKPQTPKK
ncbi:hypothetical protein G9A89_008660 [Geosiphon pyriformis]|nr:hypothetical protein G9A89_008660 [Geosiphon pyriformis]